MLDLKFIRENPTIVTQAIIDKGMSLDITLVLEEDAKVLELKKELEVLQAERNAHAKKVAQSAKEDRPKLIEIGKELSQKIEQLKPALNEAEQRLNALLSLVPNIPDSDVPKGKDSHDNVVIKQHGKKPQFNFSPLSHIELLKKRNWANFESIAKISGSRSYSLKNELVLLEMALIRFSLDKLYELGFTLVTAPSFSREEPLFGTGHFPLGKDQVYYLPEEDMYLSGTAEVPLNSLHAGEILDIKDLPIKYAGYSTCFRKEAGSAGRDVKGLIRVHQFIKVEQYILSTNDPHEGHSWQKKLLDNAESLLQALELPYQVIECCTGDMGCGKAKMFDIECFVPSENTYRETHSCSNLTDWQARRTGLRYRDHEGKIHFCYTLNNTMLASPRILVPFLENHQDIDGYINIPVALRPYMGHKSKL
jgi:seryl-tRNA synthetase